MHTAVKTRKSSGVKYRNILTSNFPMFIRLQIMLSTIHIIQALFQNVKLSNLFLQELTATINEATRIFNSMISKGSSIMSNKLIDQSQLTSLFMIYKYPTMIGQLNNLQLMVNPHRTLTRDIQ